MRTSRILSIFVLVALLASAAAPAFAQNARTITITEQQVNDSYWVTSPVWRAVSNRSVDLQSGQVVVSQTITPRRGDPMAVTITYVPYVDNGRIFWNATAMTREGKPVSGTLLAQVNTHMGASWHNYSRKEGKPGRVAAIEVTDSAIVVTLTGG